MQFQQTKLSDLPNLLCSTAAVFVLTLLLLMGCSGSDGGGSFDANSSQTANDRLDGGYRFYLFADSSGEGWNELNATDFDGAGGFSSTIVYDSDGDSTPFSGTYTVGTDGALTIEDTDVFGQTSADGRYFTTTDTSDADGDISLGVSLKSGSGMDESDLNGTYIICQIRKDASGTMSSRMRFTFDGAGGLSGDILEDSDGSSDSLTGTYTIASDGELDMIVTGLNKDFTGNVSDDGNIILILDTDDDGEILMMVGVKTATGMDLADFSGDYQLNLFNSDASSTFTSRIDLSADGAGALSAVIVAASDGDLSEQPDMAYTVASDGTLTITGTDNIGQLSSDGEIFVLVDADASSDGEVALLIGIKKS